jgi:prepilin-type N-terminal cleavage/methylation domain-containing protein
MRDGTQSGYSLAELLVVLALLGMIAATMSDSVRFGRRTWEASRDRTEALDGVAGAQGLLRTLLQRVLPRDLDPGIPTDPLLFRADGDRMRFVAATPAAVEASEVASFELAVVRGNASASLVLSWTPLAGAPDRRRQVLFAGAADIRFRFARRDQTGRLDWREDWQDQSGVPDLILIGVEGKAGAPMLWPELVIRPRITREPTCIFDAVSFGCRHA